MRYLNGKVFVCVRHPHMGVVAPPNIESWVLGVQFGGWCQTKKKEEQ